MHRHARMVRIASCLIVAWPLFVYAASSPRPDAVNADGGRYYGSLLNGKLHGRGRVEWDNGARYEGNFDNGLMSGRGRLRLGSGDVYEGEFRNGMMEGRGRMRTLDGAVYVGQFRGDFFNGQGRHETPNGEVYEGAFKNGSFHGRGRLTGPDVKYEGEFRRGQYWGQGKATYEDGAKYRGKFTRGRYHGKGRFENAEGDVYEGDFDRGEFSGTGTQTRKDGTRYEGGFLKWRMHGAGRYADASGNVYEGQFINGDLVGAGRLTGKNGGLYEGEFRQWRFHGQGVLRLPDGDVYEGGFARGVYEGEGTLTYAKPRPDGRKQDSGIWRYGMLPNDEEQQQAKINVETALYNQNRLLDTALKSLAARDPTRINLYLLAIAGDGSQEVFRREVEFVRTQFARRFGTEARSVALINSRTTVATAPMATVTSIRESLKGIAAKMDKGEDILFLFLTSHGSREHELTLNQNNMSLRGLRARELGELLRESGIRWKVVVVSACYGGGFIDSIKDDHTLVIAAARHDRMSFGCADERDFTYFGQAFFKEALPKSISFQDAFHRAEALIREWEIGDRNPKDKVDDFSLPQIANPAPIDKHLQRWWAQLAEKRPTTEIPSSTKDSPK